MGQGPGGQSQKERLTISLAARFLREETIRMKGLCLCVGYRIMENFHLSYEISY